MSALRRISDTALIGMVLVQACLGIDVGKITGKLSRALKGDTVWAITSDCLKSYRTITNAEGRFVFDGIPSGIYRLMANGPGIWQEPTKDILLRPGATVEVNLWMESKVSENEPPILSPLHGVIVDTEDRPVWGAVITDFSAHETRSNNDGRFGFCRIYAGEEFGVIVTHPDYETKKVPLAAGAGKYSDGKLKIVLRKKKER